MFNQVCFNTNRIYTFFPDFDRNNLSRWVKKNLLIRLRQSVYTFPDYLEKPDYVMYFANNMYKPSYISMFTALSFYGLIPESVVQITSITSLKTISFENESGEFSYKSVKGNLMFGYKIKAIDNNINIKIASMEKALLDLLYLNAFYKSTEDMLELRLDNDILKNEFNKDTFFEFCKLMKNKSLDKRALKLVKAYNL